MDRLKKFISINVILVLQPKMKIILDPCPIDYELVLEDDQHNRQDFDENLLFRTSFNESYLL